MKNFKLIEKELIEDIYNPEFVEILAEDDEIDSLEEGFMIGYLAS